MQTMSSKSEHERLMEMADAIRNDDSVEVVGRGKLVRSASSIRKSSSFKETMKAIREAKSRVQKSA